MMQQPTDDLLTCPSCKQEHRPDARFCPNCGASLAESGAAEDQADAQERPGILASVKRMLNGSLEEGATPAGETGSPGEVTSRSAPVSLPPESLIAERYRTVQAYPLTTCVYYDAAEPESDEIQFLIREAVDRPRLDQETKERVFRISRQGTPQVLGLLQIVYAGDRCYTVVDHPGLGWRNLGKVPAPVRPLQQAIDWTLQVGNGLANLHTAGLGGWQHGVAGREAILILPDNSAWLADPALGQVLDQSTVQKDIHWLAALVYYLATGRDLDPKGQVGDAPSGLRPIIRRGASGAYPDVETMLDELARSAEVPVLERELRQSAGNATHPGLVRDLNQDFVAALTYSLDQSGQTAPIGLYIVADGMGGHMAGELASKGSARQAFMHFIEQRLLPSLKGKTQRLDREGEPASILMALIHQANRLVYQSRQASASDRGTTMTAAMIIGDQVVVANVGDSRTYLMRDGRLERITQDHSLIASLVQAGRLQPDELYSHPDRHQIYRSLGDKPELEVDVFEKRLQKGDQLLLCSDGLWEMVRDPIIGETLVTASSPQAACDRLVEQANAGGGEDNISVIVVNIE
ncbi:MAG: protein phosphatase 2C domain-containing protein [Chloroflexota bacterium]|nr:MAG: protein phosphatase 2C domain-containing protein [Chloroflexota bacterium]